MLLKSLQYNNRKGGFTIIELLVVISIIGLLSTISVVSLNGARQKSRDVKRLGDVKQIKTALELYYNDLGIYPPAGIPISLGTSSYKVLCDQGFVSSTSSCNPDKIYMGNVPSNPSPNGIPYTYTSITSSDNYSLSYSLEQGTSSIPAGYNVEGNGGLDTLSQGLILDIPMDIGHTINVSTVADISGNGNNGIINGATVGSSETVFIGLSNQSINCGNNSLLNLMNNYTISVWIKPTTLAAAYHHIISKAESGSTVQMTYALFTNNSLITFLIANGSTSNAVSSPNSLFINNWYHILVTSTSTQIKIYVDGVIKNAYTKTITPINQSTKKMFIGTNGAGGESFDGSISDIKIWSRVLTDNEITTIYSQGR